MVPLQLHIAGPPLFRSVDAFPGQPVRYSVQLADNSFIRLTAEPVRHRRQRMTVEFFEYFSESRPISQMTLTATGADGTTRQLPVAAARCLELRQPRAPRPRADAHRR